VVRRLVVVGMRVVGVAGRVMVRAAGRSVVGVVAVVAGGVGVSLRRAWRAVASPRGLWRVMGRRLRTPGRVRRAGRVVVLLTALTVVLGVVGRSVAVVVVGGVVAAARVMMAGRLVVVVVSRVVRVAGVVGVVAIVRRLAGGVICGSLVGRVRRRRRRLRRVRIPVRFRRRFRVRRCRRARVGRVFRRGMRLCGPRLRSVG